MLMSAITESPLYKIACPESIAIFGASNKFSAMGSSILNAILTDGYEGRIFPVHPKENKVMNLDAYSHVRDLPEVPDLAYIVLPTKIVADTLRACGEKGIRSAVIVTAGFNEVGGEGPARQAELKAVARKYNIRFIGPNCIGMVNSHLKLNATFIPSTCQPGFIGMASQSGSFITQMFDYLGSRFGRGFSTGFSLGNEADIDMADCIRYLGACPNTRAIALYIESIRRGGRSSKRPGRSLWPSPSWPTMWGDRIPANVPVFPTPDRLPDQTGSMTACSNRAASFGRGPWKRCSISAMPWAPVRCPKETAL